jgi:hypothetical protein
MKAQGATASKARRKPQSAVLRRPRPSRETAGGRRRTPVEPRGHVPTTARHRPAAAKPSAPKPGVQRSAHVAQAAPAVVGKPRAVKLAAVPVNVTPSRSGATAGRSGSKAAASRPASSGTTSSQPRRSGTAARPSGARQSLPVQRPSAARTTARPAVKPKQAARAVFRRPARPVAQAAGAAATTASRTPPRATRAVSRPGPGKVAPQPAGAPAAAVPPPVRTAGGEPPEQPTCPHHWQIPSPNGPTSIGMCKHCGETREFRNSIPGGGWEREASEARKARAAAARAQSAAAAMQVARARR